MGHAPPSDNVWIGDLPPSLSQEECEAVFRAYGSIAQCRVMPPKQPGQKASALVRFGSVEEASWIVENLNGNLAEGLAEPIVARFANPPGSVRRDFKEPVTTSAPPSDNVWVGDLPATLSKDECEAIFQAYGSVAQCRVMPPKQPGQKASALVRFNSVDQAQWIVENLNGNLVHGLTEPIVARFANSPGSYGKDGKDGGKGGCLAYRSEPYGGKGAGGGCSWGKDGGVGNGHLVSKGHGKALALGSFASLYGAVKKAGLLGAGTTPQECQVYIKNLPSDTTDADLYKLFSPFGAIAPSGCKAMTNDDGTCKGFGFVDFVEPLAASTATATLNGFTTPEGNIVGVSIKMPSKKGKGKGEGRVVGPPQFALEEALGNYGESAS